jgi:hypothetical protein
VVADHERGVLDPGTLAAALQPAAADGVERPGRLLQRQFRQVRKLGDSPRQLPEELSAVQSGDVLLPTRNPDGSAAAMLMIRCVTRPDEHTAVLLNRLGIELPNPLRRQRLGSETPVAAGCPV